MSGTLFPQIFSKFIRKSKSEAQAQVLLDTPLMKDVYDLLLESEVQRRASASKNPLNKFGGKVFSQTDEDGITLEICRRMGLENGFYCEFGVGNGLECNTLVLASLQWRGFWVGGEQLAFSMHSIDKKNFSYVNEWVTSKMFMHYSSRVCIILAENRLMF